MLRCGSTQVPSHLKNQRISLCYMVTVVLPILYSSTSTCQREHQTKWHSLFCTPPQVRVNESIRRSGTPYFVLLHKYVSTRASDKVALPILYSSTSTCQREHQTKWHSIFCTPPQVRVNESIRRSGTPYFVLLHKYVSTRASDEVALHILYSSTSTCQREHQTKWHSLFCTPPQVRVNESIRRSGTPYFVLLHKYMSTRASDEVALPILYSSTSTCQREHQTKWHSIFCTPPQVRVNESIRRSGTPYFVLLHKYVSTRASDEVALHILYSSTSTCQREHQTKWHSLFCTPPQVRVNESIRRSGTPYFVLLHKYMSTRASDEVALPILYSSTSTCQREHQTKWHQSV